MIQDAHVWANAACGPSDAPHYFVDLMDRVPAATVTRGMPYAEKCRRLGECSAMGNVEHEILLMANFKAAVVKELYRDDNSGVRCIDLLELSEESVHIF